MFEAVALLIIGETLLYNEEQRNRVVLVVIQTEGLQVRGTNSGLLADEAIKVIDSELVFLTNSGV